MKLVKDFLRDESGMTAAEYGIILGLITAAVTIGIATFYSELGNLFGRWGTWFSTKTTP